MFFLNIFVLGLLGPGPARDQSGPRRHPHPSPSIFSNPHTSRIHVRQERRWRLPLDHGVHGGTTLRDRKLGFHGVWRIARCSAREAWYPRRSHMPCAEVFFFLRQNSARKKNSTHGGSKFNLFDMFSCRSTTHGSESFRLFFWRN